MLAKINPAVEAIQEPSDPDQRNSSNITFVNDVAKKNVALTIDRIKAESPVLNEMLVNGEIEIVGGMYDIHSGEVTFY